jgi:hypothetical protein
VQHDAQHSRVAQLRGEVDGTEPVHIARADVGALAQQQLDEAQALARVGDRGCGRAGHEQRARLEVVARVHVRARVEQRLGVRHDARRDGLDERAQRPRRRELRVDACAGLEQRDERRVGAPARPRGLRGRDHSRRKAARVLGVGVGAAAQQRAHGRGVAALRGAGVVQRRVARGVAHIVTNPPKKMSGGYSISFHREPTKNGLF